MKIYISSALSLMAGFYLAGCQKSIVPELPDLIQKSSVIYVAESRSGAYYISRILKESSTTQPLYSPGQVVILNRELVGYKPETGKRVIVFFEKAVMDKDNKSHPVQWEIPVSPEGDLSLYRVSYDELILMIGRKQ